MLKKKIYFNPRVKQGELEVGSSDPIECGFAIVKINGRRRTLSVNNISSYCAEKLVVNPLDFGYARPYPDFTIGKILYIEEDYPHE